MSDKVAELRFKLNPETSLARAVVDQYETFRQNRSAWEAEQLELRNYLFATDTSKTSNQDLPWRNKTTLPKLTQIRDNLHANYIAALFPNDDWLKWEGETQEDQIKAQAIENYMKNKIKMGGFRETISRLLLDYIDYGNAFADAGWVEDYKEYEGETIAGFIGPKAIRLDPMNHFINPASASYHGSPKITRKIITLGELKLMASRNPEMRYLSEALGRAEKRRGQFNSGYYTVEDFKKAQGYTVDGFGNLYEYYQSPYVEIIELEGNIHDSDSGELLEDYVITIMDRAIVIRQEPIKTWLPTGTKHHAAWRIRPDNLYGMGPLHNLVGMQYRIDHLENLKADVFDLIAFPPLKIRGEVEEFNWGPLEQIHLTNPEDDVDMLNPDTTALQADLQIQLLEEKMEQYAGAPRDAMGIRTPGEKTAFEVEQLQSAAARIFAEKVQNFEVTLLEPLLNSMLEIAKRNMTEREIVRVMDDDIGVEAFASVSKEDITANGKLRPIGARHFSAQRLLIQNLVNTFNSPVGQMVMPHTSGKNLAKLLESTYGLERYELFRDNIAVIEQMETQRLVQAAQQTLGEEQMVDTEDPETDEGLPLPEGGPAPF